MNKVRVVCAPLLAIPMLPAGFPLAVVMLVLNLAAIAEPACLRSLVETRP